mgnify:CR=1 FL=1
MSEINKKTDAKGELKSVERFSSRAAEYSRHRPSYPQAALDRLEQEGWVEIGTKVADVGSGTGIFSEQLMGKGCRVWAIEPSSEMRGIAEGTLGSRSQFHSVTGDAGSIPLDDDSVDLVCAAQAFHWFDVEAARRERERREHEGVGVAVRHPRAKRRAVADVEPPAVGMERDAQQPHLAARLRRAALPHA